MMGTEGLSAGDILALTKDNDNGMSGATPLSIWFGQPSLAGTADYLVTEVLTPLFKAR